MWTPFDLYRKSSRLAPRKRLLRDLLLLLILTVGSLLVAVFIAGESLRIKLAQEQIRTLAQKTSDDLSDFLQIPENSLRMAQGWGAMGDLDLNDASALVNRFIPMLENLSRISSLILADTNGRSFYLAHTEKGWISRNLDENGNAIWHSWSEPNVHIEERRGQEDYDPRTQPWFKGALAMSNASDIFWTRPYLLFNERKSGLTGAVRFHQPDEPKHDYVLGLNLPLDNVLSALATLKVSSSGTAFITEANGAVLLPSATDPGTSFTFPVSLSPEQLDTESIFAATKAWLKAGRPARQPLSYSSGGGGWWTWLQPLGDPDKGLWLGITVPELDFLGTLQNGWTLVLAVGMMVLASGLIASLLLTRHYGRQFKALPSLTEHPAEFEERVLSLIHYGENPNLEFKSTLRTNLKTGKTGKEIELAWIKSVVGFLNTDGGILLIGVNDGGEVIGIAADQFENDDKCLLHFKNLINQHIGAEFSKYLHAETRPVTGKTLVAVVCEKAREPVFLLVGVGHEEFYIRSGPSTIKLTPRQMLQYLSVR